MESVSHRFVEMRTPVPFLTSLFKDVLTSGLNKHKTVLKLSCNPVAVHRHFCLKYLRVLDDDSTFGISHFVTH